MVRKSVAAEQCPNHELNLLRSKLLVPGTDLNLGRSEARIPVLLLHCSGIRTSVGNEGNESTGMLGYGGGWDVVLPRKWGMPFWIGLVYRGARACGLREAGKVALHRSMPRFPYDFPDSEAGCDISKSIAGDLEQTFQRKPPAKRPNHAKLGIAAPFCPPWSQLISEWGLKETGDHISESGGDACVSSMPEDWYVLRNKEKLGLFRTVMQGWSKKVRGGGGGKKQEKWNTEGGKGSSRTEGKGCPGHLSLEPLTQVLVPSEKRTIVWVGLRMVTRGFPSQFAIICLPSAADLAELGRNPNYGGPEEPVHKEFRLKKKRKLEKGQKGSKAKKAKVAQESRPEPPSTPGDFGFVIESKDEFGGRDAGTTSELGSSESQVENSGLISAVALSNKSDTVSIAADTTLKLTGLKDSKQATPATVVDTTKTMAPSASTRAEATGHAATNTTVQSEVVALEASSVRTNVEHSATAVSKSPDSCLSPAHPELLKSCTRSIIGFVTNGAQSFSCGKGMGVGFCATLGLLNLLRDSPRGRKLVVLVRDVQSLQYRFAYIYVPSS